MSFWAGALLTYLKYKRGFVDYSSNRARNSIGMTAEAANQIDCVAFLVSALTYLDTDFAIQRFVFPNLQALANPDGDQVFRVLAPFARLFIELFPNW